MNIHLREVICTSKVRGREPWGCTTHTHPLQCAYAAPPSPYPGTAAADRSTQYHVLSPYLATSIQAVTPPPPPWASIGLGCACTCRQPPTAAPKLQHTLTQHSWCQALHSQHCHHHPSPPTSSRPPSHTALQLLSCCCCFHPCCRAAAAAMLPLSCCCCQDGDRFWRMPEIFIRGNTLKYIRIPEEVSEA